MIRLKQQKTPWQQFLFFMRSEGLPCLFVILMLCNGLFFTYVIIDVNQVNVFYGNVHSASAMTVEDVETNNNETN